MPGILTQLIRPRAIWICHPRISAKVIEACAGAASRRARLAILNTVIVLFDEGLGSCAKSLFHFNLVAMAISCALLVGGWSVNRCKAGAVAIGLGVLGLLLVLLNSVFVLTNGTPIWAP